jgi:chloride channel 3/4/5
LVAWDACQGWVAVAIIGILTACVAFMVDIAEATVSDWKYGYCTTNPFWNRIGCCASELSGLIDVGENCSAWHTWSHEFGSAFGIYTGFALLFGIVSASITMTTKTVVSAPINTEDMDGTSIKKKPADGKVMYLAAGSGIPEIKTILSGFVIPGILSIKVLIVKAVGAVFAVATGMCLGKEVCQYLIKNTLANPY